MSSPISPRTPDTTNQFSFDDFSLIQVNSKSPPKLLYNGIVSDEEEDEEEEYESEILKQLQTVEKIAGIYLEVTFKHPKTHEKIKQTIPLSSAHWDESKTSLKCVFSIPKSESEEKSDPVLYSARFEGDSSVIRIFFKEGDDKETKLLRVYSGCLSSIESMSISSINARFNSKFRYLTKEEQDKYFPKPKCAKKLNFDLEEGDSSQETSTIYQMHVENNSVRYAGIVALSEAEVVLKIAED